MEVAGRTDIDAINVCSPFKAQYQKLKKESKTIKCDHYRRIQNTYNLSPEKRCTEFRTTVFGIPLNEAQVYRLMKKGFDQVRTKDWTSTLTVGFFGNNGCEEEINKWCLGQEKWQGPESSDNSSRIHDLKEKNSTSRPKKAGESSKRQ